MKNFKIETELMREVISFDDRYDHMGIQMDPFGDDSLTSMYYDMNNDARLEVTIVNENLFNIDICSAEGIQTYSNVAFSIEDVISQLKKN